MNALNKCGSERRPAGKARKARDAKPTEESAAASGNMCEPRLKSHRIWGRDRDAGRASNEGMEKSERAAMPPAPISDVEMLRVWRRAVGVCMLRVGE